LSDGTSTSFVVPSEASLLRILREQGVTDLGALVKKGLDAAEEVAEKEDEPPVVDVFISAHYVYVYHEPGPATP
jgi:hypothetical protein